MGTLGGASSEAYAINKSGVIVGRSFIPGNLAFHATRWVAGSAADLGTLGGLNSYAFDINASGTIVGRSQLAGSDEYHATIWQGSTPIDLNNWLDPAAKAAGWVLSEASGINASGEITGSALNPLLLGSTAHAFRLSPP